MADEGDFHICECFYTHNIFLKGYGVHVTFENERKFEREYRRVRRLFVKQAMTNDY